jgi:CHAT domain-containing protein/tetratricopeptide (TPR) repeat protein
VYRSQLERIASMPDADRAREVARLSFPESVLLELIDEVRDLVMSDLTRALEQAEILCLIADRLEASIASARARTALAHALNYANRFTDAIHALDEADQIAAAREDEIERAHVSLTKIQSYARLGRFADAIGCCEHAERVFRESEQPELAVRAVTNHAILHRMLGQWSESIDRFDQALRLAKGDPTTTAQIQSNRAESLLELGRFRQAESAFRESCELLDEAGMPRVAAIVRGNLADLLGRQGRFSEAIEQFELARRFFEQDRAPGDLARLEAELADVLAAIGLLDDAAELYARSDSALQEVGLTAERARALTGLASVLLKRDPARAGDALTGAQQLYDTLGNAAGQTTARLLRGRLALLAGDTAQALAFAADPPAGTVEPPTLRLFRIMLRGDIELANENLEAAHDLIARAIEDAGTLALPSVLADLHHRMARVLCARGSVAEAVEQYRHAMHHLDRIRGALQGDRLRAAFIDERHEVFSEATAVILQAGGPDAQTEAFDVTERGRSRALLDLISGDVELADQIARAARSEDESRLLMQLAEQRAALNFLYSRIDPAAEVDTAPKVTDWLSELHLVESRVTGLESRLSASRAGRGVLATPQPGVELADSLDPDHALLTYARCGDSLGCFVVRRGAIHFVDLRLGLDELESLAGNLSFQFRRAIVRGSGSSARAAKRTSAAISAAFALHDAVLHPVLPLLSDIARVTCVPTADLHTVPFGALHDGDAFLIERMSVTNLPSASLLSAITRPENRTTGRSLVVGVADRFAPHIDAEARAVAHVLPDPCLLTGADATADGVLGQLAGADFIHLAAHGIFPPGNPLAAAIKLHDRWLTAREIFSLDLDGAAVTLSGCETGRARVDSGEEVYGFVRAFLAAGASGLVSCLWASHDATARELMSRMYAEAPKTGTPAARLFSGLHRAQRQAIKNGTHPGLWSGFIAIGVA